MSASGPLTRAQRVSRAAVLSASAVFVAALSHFFGGGAAPSLVSMAVSMIVAMPFVMIFISRTFRPIGTTVAVSFAQALFHWLFSSLGIGGVASLAGPNGEELSPHAHHMAQLVSFTPLPTESVGVAMWIAHGFAAVMTVWLLRSGETALRRLAQGLHGLVRRASTRTVCIHLRPLALTCVACTTQGTLQRLLLSSRSHRGPPIMRARSHTPLSAH